MMNLRLFLIVVMAAVSNAAFANTMTRAAEAAFESGDYAKAAALYTERIADKPSATLYLSLGHACYKLRDFEAAVQAYAGAAAMQKDAPQALALRCLGNAYYCLQRYTDALDSYHQAAAIEAEAKDTFQIALCYTQLNQWSLARAAVLRYLEHSPGDRAALELLAHIQLSSGQPQEAVALLSQLFDTDPANPQHLKGLANALMAAKRYDEAIDILECSVRTVGGDDLSAMQMLADLYVHQQMFTQALRLYRQISALKPAPSADDCYRLGYAALQSRQTATAYNAFQEMLRISPNHYDAHLCLAQIAADQLDYDTAFRHYQSAASARPESGQPHVLMAGLYLRRGNYPLAIEHYKTTISLGHDGRQAYYNCLLAMLKTQDDTHIRPLFKQAIARWPLDAELNALLERFVTMSQGSQQ